jgi:2-keto-3-deoxy-L-rhamnonate aldolase RhmA
MIRICRNPAIVPIAKQAGLDFIMLDMEHGGYSWETLSDILLTGKMAGLDVYVRVPELARGYVSRVLDCGATGVMVPMVETVEQAKALADWAKYPPLGGRGLSSSGCHTAYRRESSVDAWMASANQSTLAIAQVETAKGAEEARGIASVDGIDVLLVGPNDLAVSLGCAGQLTCPREEQAIRKIADAAHEAGKRFGMHAGAQVLERWIPGGMEVIMNSIDTTFLAEGLERVRDSVRSLLAHPQAPRPEK